MAKPDSFEAVNEAAGEKFLSMLAGNDSPAETPAAEEPTPDSPASDAVGTTPTNDDGEKPTGQDVAGSGNKEAAGSADRAPSDSESEFDPQKTLEKYKTPEEREKALVESQRELVRRGEENRRLKAELEASKGKAPEKPETPSPDTLGYDEWLGRVHAGKPEELSPDEVRIQRAIVSLGEEKKNLKTVEAKASELQSKITSKQAEMDRVRVILEAQEEDFKADTYDTALEARIAANKAKLEKSGQDLTILRLDLREETDRLRDAKAKLEEGIVYVDRQASTLHSQSQRNREAATSKQAEVKRLDDEWRGGMKKLFEADLKTDGFSTVEQENIETWLQRAVNDHAVKTGKLPADLYAWQKSQKAVFDRARQHRVEIQKAIINRKVSDLPAKPSDNVASGTARSGKPSSFKQTLKSAESKLDRALGF